MQTECKDRKCEVCGRPYPRTHICKATDDSTPIATNEQIDPLQHEILDKSLDKYIAKHFKE